MSFEFWNNSYIWNGSVPWYLQANSTDELSDEDLDPSPAWQFLSLSAIPVWIIVGNLMVLKVVIGRRSFRTRSNYVIGSLAVSDLSLAVFVIPLAIYSKASEKYNFTIRSISDTCTQIYIECIGYFNERMRFNHFMFELPVGILLLILYRL